MYIAATASFSVLVRENVSSFSKTVMLVPESLVHVMLVAGPPVETQVRVN